MVTWSQLNINQKITFKMLCCQKSERIYRGIKSHDFLEACYLLAKLNGNWAESFSIFMNKN